MIANCTVDGGLELLEFGHIKLIVLSGRVFIGSKRILDQIARDYDELRPLSVRQLSEPIHAREHKGLDMGIRGVNECKVLLRVAFSEGKIHLRRFLVIPGAYISGRLTDEHIWEVISGCQ